MKRFLVVFCTILGSILFTHTVNAQSKMSMFRDTLDGALDMGHFLQDANGFIPVPIIITEPALGNFGLGIAPVFMHKKKLSPEAAASFGANKKFIPPDITAGFVGYTLNNSWFVGAARTGTFLKPRIRYRVAAAYADINMNFYKTFPVIGEKSFELNMKGVPFYITAMKQLGKSNWFLGLEYLFLYTKITNAKDNIPSFVTPLEVDSKVSKGGAILEFDKRDNIFTPNKGIRFQATAGFSDDAIGSDYEYQQTTAFAYFYHPIVKNKLIGALRADWNQVFDNPPFYLNPFIDLRGIPKMRYQGSTTLLSEAELRWDFVPRWSLVGFGGLGKAFNNYDEFGDATWAYSGGGGFRYLIARAFGMRAGIDIARGNESWAYYIVFGSAWVK